MKNLSGRAEQPRFYVYKLTVDDGAAPCVQQKMLSLAICKPQIRKTAIAGDFILGFAANRLAPEYPDNCLIYVAKLTEPVEGKDYFSNGRYQARRDSIYRWHNGKFSCKPNKFHTAKDPEHDLGSFPVYEKARVLVSAGASNFRYFGPSNPIDYKSHYKNVARTIENLTQGHRVNHPSELKRELEALIQQAWSYSSVRQQVRASTSHGICHPAKASPGCVPLKAAAATCGG